MEIDAAHDPPSDVPITAGAERKHTAALPSIPEDTGATSKPPGRKKPKPMRTFIQHEESSDEAEGDGDAEDDAGKEPVDPEKQNVLDMIANNKPLSQQVEDYLWRSMRPESNRTIYTTVLALINKHGWEADWGYAKSIAEYNADETLVDDTWGVPVPKELNREDVTNDEVTQRVKDCWRSDQISEGCREYVRFVLTDGDLAAKYDLMRRIRTCDSLIEAHPMRNHHDWAHAPEPDRYLMGCFDFNKTWPLTYNRLRELWRETRDAVGQQHPPAETMESVETLYKFAKELFYQKELNIPPVSWPGKYSAEDYVTDRLQPLTRANALALVEPLWNEYGYERPCAQRDFWNSEHDDMTDSELPYIPKEAEWRVRWENVENQFLNTEPRTLQTTQRFQDLKGLADSSFDKYGDLLIPAVWDTDLTPLEYCEALWQELHLQWLKCLHDCWNYTIDMASS